MKAAILPSIGSPLEVADVPDPKPNPFELVLRVGACGICGTDLHMSENYDPNVGWRVLEAGCIMGHEFAGEVVEVGKSIRDQWSVGARVTALPWIGCGNCQACQTGRGFRCIKAKMRASIELPGAFAEYCRVGAHETIILPENVSFKTGALIEPLAVGLNAVRKAKLQPNDSVIVIGAGPVGLSVALWCRFFGAQHIIVSDLIADRAQKALDLGATAAVDAMDGEVMGHIEEIINNSPKVIFDCVGLPGSLQLAIDYAPSNGRIVVAGLCMAADQIFPTKALVKELDISFAFIYGQEDFNTVASLLGDGRINPAPLISDEIDLFTLPDVFEALKNPTTQAKVVFTNT